MCKLDKDLIKATVSLKGMTKEQADCLAAFMDCKPLVEWLRDSMKCMALTNIQSRQIVQI